MISETLFFTVKKAALQVTGKFLTLTLFKKLLANAE